MKTDLPPTASAQEHIAELYRRIDALNDCINDLDLAFYPICLTLHLQAPHIFATTIDTLSEIHHRRAEQDAARNSYVFERFLTIARATAEQAAHTKLQAEAAAGRPNA